MIRVSCLPISIHILRVIQIMNRKGLLLLVSQKNLLFVTFFQGAYYLLNKFKNEHLQHLKFFTIIIGDSFSLPSLPISRRIFKQRRLAVRKIFLLIIISKTRTIYCYLRRSCENFKPMGSAISEKYFEVLRATYTKFKKFYKYVHIQYISVKW